MLTSLRYIHKSSVWVHFFFNDWKHEHSQAYSIYCFSSLRYRFFSFQVITEPTMLCTVNFSTCWVEKWGSCILPSQFVSLHGNLSNWKEIIALEGNLPFLLLCRNIIRKCRKLRLSSQKKHFFQYCFSKQLQVKQLLGGVFINC